MWLQASHLDAQRTEFDIIMATPWVPPNFDHVGRWGYTVATRGPVICRLPVLGATFARRSRATRRSNASKRGVDWEGTKSPSPPPRDRLLMIIPRRTLLVLRLLSMGPCPGLCCLPFRRAMPMVLREGKRVMYLTLAQEVSPLLMMHAVRAGLSHCSAVSCV